MKWVGQAICYFGLYLLWQGTLGQRAQSFGTPYDFGTMIVFGIPGLVVLAIGYSMLQKKEEKETTDDSIFARRIFDQLALRLDKSPFTTPITAFSLYLRPFDIAESLTISRDTANLFDWDLYARPGQDSFERVLAEALSGTAPLVGLGAEAQQLGGAGRAGLKDNWQLAISEAMSCATFIFVVPATNDGTMWELQQIAERKLFHKTVFVMPPSGYRVKSERYSLDTWIEVSETVFGKTGLRFPAHEINGALFAFDANGALAGTLELGPLTPDRIAHAANGVLQKSRRATQEAGTVSTA